MFYCLFAKLGLYSYKFNNFFLWAAQLDIINLLRLGHTSANQFECFFHVLTWLCD